jgi:hypothetical protein
MNLKNNNNLIDDNFSKEMVNKLKGVFKITEKIKSLCSNLNKDIDDKKKEKKL